MTCDNSNCDYNYLKYVGWPQTAENVELLQYLFQPSTVKMVSKKISELLEGVHPEGKKIVVSDRVICATITTIYSDKRPDIGNLYALYNIPQEMPRNDCRSIIIRTIELITTSIKNEFGMIEINKNLSIWDSVYGDFNRRGLRAHPPIKTQEKHPQHMMFNMNY